MSELDSILAQFETPQAAGTEPATPAPAPETPPTPAPQTVADPEPATEPEPQAQPEPDQPKPGPNQDPEQLFNTDPRNVTFARLRVQNRQYQDALGKFAKILGVEAKDPEALVTTLEQKVLEFEAQQSNVPVEVLKEVDEARKAKAQQEFETYRTNALLGFQKVKDTFGIKDGDLQEFATQLNNAGKNPFTEAIDLVQEYRTLNFEKILQQERDKAVAEALAQQRKAAQHSTTPLKAQGAPAPAATSVKTVDALDSLLRQGGYN